MNARTKKSVQLSKLFVPRLWVAQAVQVGGALSVIWAIASGVDTGWWFFALAVYFATSCLGMAVGVHRAICHRAFTLNRFVERMFSIFASIGMTGSPLGWVGTHRTHHAHSDVEGDPHSPEAHGWKLLWTGPQPNIEGWRIRDVLRDRFQRELHRQYLLVVGAWVLLLFLINPTAVIFGFLVPASFQVTVTNLSTILAHGYGYRNFETHDDSTNNVLLSILTWGEGWHNNHHARPRHWSVQKRWWEIDIAALCVRGLTVLGLIDRDSFAEPI